MAVPRRAPEGRPAGPVPAAVERAAARRRRGVAANSAGQPQQAARHFRAGLRLLGPDPAAHPAAAAQAARLLISLAHAEAEQGRVEHGLDLLDRADQLAASGDRGLLLSQRALLQWRAGRYGLALPLFDAAVARLTAYPDPVVLARALLNRAGLHMAQMRLGQAKADLVRCELIAREHGAPLQAAKAVNGLGYCELLVGNIPAALELLNRAEAEYREHGAGNVPITQVDRARALMAAGLAHEAVPGLEAAITAFRTQRLTQDRADAEVALAQALAAAANPGAAAEQARRAERHFRARGNETGATLARLVAARAEFDRCFATERIETRRFAPSNATAPNLRTRSDPATEEDLPPRSSTLVEEIAASSDASTRCGTLTQGIPATDDASARSGNLAQGIAAANDVSARGGTFTEGIATADDVPARRSTLTDGIPAANDALARGGAVSTGIAEANDVPVRGGGLTQEIAREILPRAETLPPPASPPAPGSAARLARRAGLLAERLEELGLVRDAVLARLLAARALLRSGAPAEQVGRCIRSAIPRGISLPLETRLSAHLARAELAIAQDARDTAYAELRKGLALLHAHRTALGSLDLQTGVAALGAELTGTGLRLALAGGAPRTIFAWSERSRAQTLRVRPVRPAEDPDVAEQIAELRHLDHLLHTGAADGEDGPELHERHGALRRRLLEHSWTTAGSGARPGHEGSPATLSAVLAELDACGQRMISFLRHGDRLLALVLADGRARPVVLGDYARAAEAIRRLAGDLDAQTARRLPAQMQAVIVASVQRQLRILTDELLTPLHAGPRLLPDDGSPLVLIPTGTLSAVPWSLLPDLAHRPVTVCPSARMWLTARHARNGRDGEQSGGQTGETDPRPVLVAGPRLANARREIDAIAGCYADPHTLTGAQASVEATLRAMDGAHTVHLAVHGHHEYGNVLFSRIDLADGPLMAYDLQRLARPPQRVILSACHVGHAEIRSGDEHLGFTTALLHSGTSTVIASNSRVADDLAPRLMTTLHQVLAAGANPASALAGAAAQYEYSTFVCHGAG